MNLSFVSPDETDDTKDNWWKKPEKKVNENFQRKDLAVPA